MKFNNLLRYKETDELINSKGFIMLSNYNGESVLCLNQDYVIKKLRYLFELHILSNCTKTKVACILFDEQLKHSSSGVNHVFGVETCEVEECKKDFSQKPKHRHGICKAVHSEVVALRNWFGGTIERTPYHAFVTRYPCEDCISKLSTMGVKIIYYSTIDSNNHTNILDESNLRYLEDKYSIIIRSYDIHMD